MPEVANVVADQVLTVACSAVGAHWFTDFPICVDQGLWGSKSSTAKRMGHLDAFDRIQPGQLGIAVHGFRWRAPNEPPRNAKGSAYGPRAPFEHFLKAQFSEFMLFEVDGPSYRSTSQVWSADEPDEWDLRIPINVFAHETDVELRMDAINPAVAEAIRMSGIYASMPCVFAPARLGLERSSNPAASDFSAPPTDVLGLSVRRREASALRGRLVTGVLSHHARFVSASVSLKTSRLCTSNLAGHAPRANGYTRRSRPSHALVVTTHLTEGCSLSTPTASSEQQRPPKPVPGGRLGQLA